MSEQPKHQPQFELLSIFATTFWAAVFCLSLVLFNRLSHHELVEFESEGPALIVLGAALFISLPAAIVSIFGRWWIGALVGLGLFVAYGAFCLIAVSIYGI